MAKAVFGAGCFWGVEKKFSGVIGVNSTEVGYSQGKNSKTSYEEVCTGTTDHVEVVLVEFEENKVSYENLVHLFYDLHDPTTPNQQGPDRGTQYRSLLGYFDEGQKVIAETISEKLNKEKFDNKITTTIEEVKNYCPAEEYHQKYIEKKYSFLNI
jgi:peptide-methionine (S)-S-oxide reductase